MVSGGRKVGGGWVGGGWVGGGWVGGGCVGGGWVGGGWVGGGWGEEQRVIVNTQLLKLLPQQTALVFQQDHFLLAASGSFQEALKPPFLLPFLPPQILHCR